MKEYISKDIMDESYTKLFAPFHYIQSLLGTCRVDVRDQFATAPTALQKLYTVHCVSLVFMVYMFDYVMLFFRFIKYPIICLLASLAFIVHYGAYVYTAINSRFVNNNANVKFYVKMHEIDRLLNINKIKSFNDKLYKYNLGTILVLTSIIGFFYVLAILEDLAICLGYFVLVITELAVTVEWLHFCHLVIFFYERLRLINGIMCSHVNENSDVTTNKINEIIFSIKKIQPVEGQQDFERNDIDIYLKKIFESLEDFQYLYRDQMVLFCGKLVFGTLAVLEWSLLGLILPMLIIEQVALPLTVVLAFLIMVNTCYRWETFFLELKTTKFLCTTILSIHHEGPLRLKALKMIKAIEKTPPRFSVYGMWEMDLSLIFKIINLLTSLVVAILQFF